MSSARRASVEDWVGPDLQLLSDLALTMWFERPEPGPAFRHRYCNSEDFPLELDAPFGTSGPMVLDLGVLRALLSDWSSIQSVMSIDDPARLVLEYTQLMAAGLFAHPTARRIEMIGLGGGSIAKFCHRYMPDCEMAVVESDPEVLALRERFAIPGDDARLRVVCADGHDFVEADPGRPDILLVDGFDHRGRPGRLASRPFYERCRERLGKKGMLIVNLCAGHFGARRLIAKLCGCFDGQVLAISDRTRLNQIALASSDPDFLSYVEAIRAPAESLRYPWPDLSAAADRIGVVARRRRAREVPRLAAEPLVADVA